MKPAVILYKSIPEDLRRRLDKHFSVTAFDGLTDDNVQQHAQTLENAVGLIGAGGKVDNALLDRMPALKAALTISVGYDNFDVQALSERGVLLMHTPTVLTETVANTQMALVLATARRVVEYHNGSKPANGSAALTKAGTASMCIIKPLGSLAWATSAWRWCSARVGFNMDVLYIACS